MAMAAVAFEAHGLVQGMQQSCVAQKSSFSGSPIPSSSSSPSSISCKLRKTVGRESSGFGAVVWKVARSGGVRCEAQAIERSAAVKPETGSKRDVDAFSGLSQVCAVLGTQWGDEGKGKLVDILAERFDIVARCQVGASLFLFFRVLVVARELRLSSALCHVHLKLGFMVEEGHGYSYHSHSQLPLLFH